jgi:hypothetical protein
MTEEDGSMDDMDGRWRWEGGKNQPVAWVRGTVFLHEGHGRSASGAVRDVFADGLGNVAFAQPNDVPQNEYLNQGNRQGSRTNQNAQRDQRARQNA